MHHHCQARVFLLAPGFSSQQTGEGREQTDCKTRKRRRQGSEEEEVEDGSRKTGQKIEGQRRRDGKKKEGEKEERRKK